MCIRDSSSTVSFVVKESAPAPASELVIGNLVFDPMQEGYQPVPEKAFTCLLYTSRCV